MKKTLIALACCAAAGTLQAAQVEVYGLVDAYLAVNNNDGDVASALSSGGSSGNYFGFQGTEDLWEGTQAVFKIEAGFLIDDGSYAQSFAGNTDRLFHREAWVGLRDATFGQITFGRQYTPHFLTWAMTDVNGLSLGTAASPFFFPGDTATMGGDNAALDDLVRRNNSIMYVTPNLAGFTGMLYAALGEHTRSDGRQSNHEGNVYNLAVNYANGPFFIMGSVLYQDLASDDAAIYAAQNVQRRDRSADHAIYYEVAASYDFGFTKAALQLEYKDGNGTEQNPDFIVAQIGATTPCFGGRLNTTAAMLHDYDNKDKDGYSFGIRYDYDLSKRTMVYVGFEALINEDKASRSIEAGPDSSFHFALDETKDLGNDQQQFFMGIRHRF